MLLPFFRKASQSPARQRELRWIVAAHSIALGCGVVATLRGGALPWLGHAALVAAVIEGAVLIGWRLAQLSKSRSLESLLIAPLPSARVYVGEALVAVVRLFLVTLAGLPILGILVSAGLLDAWDVWVLLVVPLTWALVTGFGLTVWAYESARARRLGERIALGGVFLNLAVGLAAGEHLRQWINRLPPGLSHVVLNSFEAFHRYNPFAVLAGWLGSDRAVSEERLWYLQVLALALIAVLGARAAWRFRAHFHELHYEPAVATRRRRRKVGDRPLSWWSVRRVLNYSGRANLWLASAFGLAYAFYMLAGPAWPKWLGTRVFEVFDAAGGIPTLATALFLLAAVPAIFQYGLWDANALDRCRRLELLLLTRLTAADYWHAAAVSAWRRGRGYFAIALILLATGAWAGRLSAFQTAAAVASGTILWALYFALGFQAFARGTYAGGVGLVMSVGLPAVAYGLYQLGLRGLGALIPPGAIFDAASGFAVRSGWIGVIAAGAAALSSARLGLRSCDGNLRRWYAEHQGGANG